MAKGVEVYLKWSPVRKVLLWAVVGVLIIVAYGATAIRSSLSTTKALERQYTTLDASLREKQAVAANLPVVKEAVVKLDEHLEKAKKKLPASEEIPGLLKTVSDLGIESGLDSVLFKPGKSRPVEPKYFYSEVPFDITYTGSYHDVGEFFYKISRLPRIVSIDEVDASTSGYSDDNEPILDLTIKARTFRFLPLEERPVVSKRRGRKK